MIIEKLSIKNYRNFKEFEIKLKRFNLIIGENNIGKTNLLNALGLIFNPDISFYQKRMLEIDDIHYCTLQGFKDKVLLVNNIEDIDFPEVKVEVILSDFNKDQESIARNWLTGDWNNNIRKNKAKITYIFSTSKSKSLEKWFQETRNRLQKILQKKGEDAESFQKRKKELIDFPIRHYSYIIYGGDDPNKRIDLYLLNFLKMEFLDALRDAKTQLLASGRNTLLYKILHHKTENKLDSVKEHLFELKELLKQSDLQEIKQEIEDYLKKISIEGEDSLIDLNFTNVETSEILKRLSLTYGTDPISIDRNGLGRNNLLYISLLLSQLVGNIDNKIYFCLIGIEEPEAHLNPHLQVHLSRNIDEDNNDKKQVIITSHSTHITSQLSLDNTIVLYKEQKESKIYSYSLLDTLEEKTKRYLQKYLDATKSTMLFARKVILVEGVSEQMLIPDFFKLHHNETLEKYGISLVNVNGVAFDHFLQIIKSKYFIKCLVITDSDNNKRAKNLQDKYKDEEKIKIVITKESTFEKDIIEENKSQDTNEILFDALIATRPTKGKQLKETTQNTDINIEDFFSEIYSETQNHKAEFAMNLLEELKKDSVKFNIPNYIQEGFKFLQD